MKTKNVFSKDKHRVEFRGCKFKRLWETGRPVRAGRGQAQGGGVTGTLQKWKGHVILKGSSEHSSS